MSRIGIAIKILPNEFLNNRMVCLKTIEGFWLNNVTMNVFNNEGIFVFSIMHPCFQPPGTRKVYEEEEIENKIISKRSIQIFKYIKPETFEGVGIKNQPIASRYFHRSLSDLFNICFEKGFVVDGIAEPTFDRDKYNDSRFEWIDIPPAIIIRLKKI